MNTIGWKIKNLREINRWSQLQLAKKMGLHNSVLSKIENDIRPVESELLGRFADMFEVSADYLIGRNTGKSPTQTGKKSTTYPSSEDSSSTIREKLTVAQDTFLHTANDDSMILEGIKQGTGVLVRSQHYIEDGQMALVSWEEGEAVLRRVFFVGGGQMILQPANSAFPPTVMAVHQGKILGQAIEYTVEVK